MKLTKKQIEAITLKLEKLTAEAKEQGYASLTDKLDNLIPMFYELRHHLDRNVFTWELNKETKTLVIKSI